MPIIRNPFRRNPNELVQDDSGRPHSNGADGEHQQQSANTTKPLSIRPNGDSSPTEYKLSEINDSGVYLPPSPTEKPKFWSSRSYGSTTSSSHRSVLNENEPFNISRESFDSYRRSFDISARSPIIDPESQRPRQSLDTRRLRMPPATFKDKQINAPESHPEDRFEDVGLNDENPSNATNPAASNKPRRQGIFSRFGHSSSASDGNVNGLQQTDGTQHRPTSSHFGGQLFGRRRGASGQGAELGSIPNEKDGFVTQQTTAQGTAPEVSTER